eukprot:7822365-Lingulodinium_polyedra.AAC.1
MTCPHDDSASVGASSGPWLHRPPPRPEVLTGVFPALPAVLLRSQGYGASSSQVVPSEGVAFYFAA